MSVRGRFASRVTRRVGAVGAATGLLFGAVIAFAAPAPAADTTTIQLLTINDFHGRIAETPSNTPPIPGAAKLFGLANALKANMPTAIVAAGDLIGASTFPSAIAQDQPTIDVMNAGGLTVSSVGNHEFDKGIADLKNRVIPAANYPYLGANVYLNGQHALDSYYINEVGGLKVGYIGVVTVQTPQLVSPAGIVGVTFTDPVLEANKVAAQLKDGDESNGEADIVVLMAHEGASEDSVGGGCLGVYSDGTFSRFAQSSAAIDAIVSGHTHQSYAYEMPVPGMAKTRPVIQANEYSFKLGRITLSYDGHTVTNSTAELLDPLTATPDPAVAAIVTAAVAQSVELGKAPVGSISATFPSGIGSRGDEWAVNNLVATAQLDQTSAAGRGGAQLAFVNPGGVRTGLFYPQSGTEGDGVVTYSEAFAVNPFANDVVTVSLTGAQIVQALENQVQPLDNAGLPQSRPYLQLGTSSNFTYSYKYQPSAANALGKVEVTATSLNGTPLDPTATYRVTINSFLASGGDNFPAFLNGTDKTTTGDNDLIMFNAYLTAHPGLDPSNFAPKHTLVAGVPAGAGTPGTPAPPVVPLAPAPCPDAVATAAVTLSTGSAHPGDTIAVMGKDFAPYETVKGMLFSEPLAIGTATADENGVVLFDLVLGPDMPLGDHTVQLIGLGSDIDVSAALVVTAVPILAETGAATDNAAILGIALVLIGGAATAFGRRRRDSLVS